MNEFEMKEIVLDASWKEEDEEELNATCYRHAKDLIKPGDSYDIMILFCVCFASVCALVMMISGIKGGFTKTMVFLTLCYAFIIFICLYKPFHVALSSFLWNRNFKKRFKVNNGFSSEIKLTEEGIIFNDPQGAACGFKYSEMEEVYESENYIVFHMDDKNLYAVKSTDFGAATKDFVYKLIRTDAVDEEIDEEDEDILTETTEEATEEIEADALANPEDSKVDEETEEEADDFEDEETEEEADEVENEEKIEE